MTTALTALDKRLCVFRIADDVLNGSPLRKAVAEQGIALATFQDWLQGDKEAAVRYARAQELRGDVLADEIISIADNDDDAARARNRITSRQWLAGKLNKRYGDRIDLNVTQTIDIGNTLAEARARLRPVSDQSNVIDAQVVDSIDVSPVRPLDKQSITVRVIDAPTGDDVPDIFS
jgi:hypothetical protein